MEQKDIEQLAAEQRERAAEEIAKMQRELQNSHIQIKDSQKKLSEMKINNYFEELNARTSTVLIVIILIAILAGSYYSLTVYKPRAAYKKAEQFMQDGQYENAKAFFASLGDYEDARQKAMECDYRRGNYLLATGKYTSAVTALSGIPNYKDRDDLIADLAGTMVKTLDTGLAHSAFVRSVGTVKATGDNSFGQCEVDSWKDIAEIACGDNFTIGRTNGGHVYSTNGELDCANIIEIAAGGDFAAALTVDGNLHCYKDGVRASVSDVKHISADKNILAYINTDGNAVVSGAAFDLTAFTDLKEIETENGAVYGLRTDGTIVSTNGRLNGKTDIKHIFTCNDTVAAITKDNKMIAEGAVPASELTGAIMLAGNTDHFIMLTDSGRVKYYGPSYEGSGRVADWSDVLLTPKKEY